MNETRNEACSVTVGLPEPLLIEMGIGWTRNPADRTKLTSAHIFDYVAEIERLRATIPQWQPIETAPTDGTAIDVWFHLSDSHAARWPNVRWSHLRERWIGGPTDQGAIHWLATHWMPVPAPPIPALLVQS